MSISTAWLLGAALGVLGVLVLVLAVIVGRLRRRVGALESRLEGARSALSDAPVSSAAPLHDVHASLDGDARTQYVITSVGEPEPEPAAKPAPTLPGPVFADLLVKETVVQTASLFHGLRRALAPETRNRIRFHMRQEVKRSRKQRKAELREVRREWAARQRAAMAPEEGTAA